jgi:hypothetical protein
MGTCARLVALGTIGGWWSAYITVLDAWKIKKSEVIDTAIDEALGEMSSNPKADELKKPNGTITMSMVLIPDAGEESSKGGANERWATI